MQLYILPLAFLLLLAPYVAVRQVTIFEYEKGLRYRRGRFAGVLDSGAYWVWPRWTTIVKVDVRPVHMVVPGQEVITADGVGLMLTVSAKYLGTGAQPQTIPLRQPLADSSAAEIPAADDTPE